MGGLGAKRANAFGRWCPFEAWRSREHDQSRREARKSFKVESLAAVGTRDAGQSPVLVMPLHPVRSLHILRD